MPLILFGKDYSVVGIVRDGHATVTEAMRLRPDVIVVDVCMPILNGLDTARKINLQAPNIKFVFLTMRDDPNLAADLTPKLRTEDWVATKARAMKEIAGLSDLSEKTVEFHKNHVMKAFNLGNNAALVLFASKQGLI